MAKMRVKKGDLVQVITGRRQDRSIDGKAGDRGKQGKVLQVFPESQTVLVEGVNRITRHTRTGTNDRGGSTGGIIVREAPIHVSKVVVCDPDTKMPARVRIKTISVERDGRTVTKRERVLEPRANYARAAKSKKKDSPAKETKAQAPQAAAEAKDES